jgi:hypothetical protein
MGVSLSWLAVKGKSPEVVHAELELYSTAQPGEAAISPFVAATSNAGWHLIVARGCEHRIISPLVIKRLSRRCEVLTCTVEEHVMYSEATGWRDGQCLWSVAHSGEDEDTQKTVSEKGALPVEYPAIRERFFREQEAENAAESEVDFLFEIPVVLAQTFTGYKYDESSPAFEAHGFELLESSRKSFFQRLFAK